MDDWDRWILTQKRVTFTANPLPLWPKMYCGRAKVGGMDICAPLSPPEGLVQPGITLLWVSLYLWVKEAQGEQGSQAAETLKVEEGDVFISSYTREASKAVSLSVIIKLLLE